MVEIRSFDAIVLAGGTARRLGGADKPALKIDGVSLLDRALESASEARKVVVVGPRRETAREVAWTREEPPLGGPVAAIAAGMQLTSEDVVLVIAADLPFIDSVTVRSLLGTEGVHGAIAMDRTGKRQPLLAAYDSNVLRKRLGSLQPRGSALYDLIQGLDLKEVWVGRSADDCDTWEDVVSAREETRGGRIARTVVD